VTVQTLETVTVRETLSKATWSLLGPRNLFFIDPMMPLGSVSDVSNLIAFIVSQFQEKNWPKMSPNHLDENDLQLDPGI